MERNRRSIHGEITLHGKGIQILISQIIRILHVYNTVIFLAQKLLQFIEKKQLLEPSLFSGNW